MVIKIDISPNINEEQWNGKLFQKFCWSINEQPIILCARMKMGMSHLQVASCTTSICQWQPMNRYLQVMSEYWSIIAMALTSQQSLKFYRDRKKCERERERSSRERWEIEIKEREIWRRKISMREVL